MAAANISMNVIAVFLIFVGLNGFYLLPPDEPPLRPPLELLPPPELPRLYPPPPPEL
jgi:hypothetical protein